MTEGWVYLILVVVLVIAAFLAGYIIAKWYWYERGYCDAQDVMNHYARSRERANRDAVPRLGRVDRE
jgi:hypothetical protein